MELQNYLENNNNYVDNLKDRGFVVKNFNKYNLKIIKYPFGKDIDLNTYERYLKGCIIDTKTNKVVFIPPVKADALIDTNINSNEYKIQELYDGTMINLFYHNDEWLMSTRSDIGCNNKWSNNKSFKELFNECSSVYSDGIDYNLLNKNYTYSFVMQHMENRNVSIINENMLILVEVYDRNTLEMVNLESIRGEYNGFQIVFDFDLNSLEEYINIILTNNNPSKFSYKGFTMKRDGKRINFINPEFRKVKDLKTNSNNQLFNYCNYKKNNTLEIYLYYFGEFKHSYKRYDDVYEIFKHDLLDTYVKVNIKKELEKKNIPFQLKPLIYELHGIYLQTKQKINMSKVDEYIKNLESNRLTFILKYYL